MFNSNQNISGNFKPRDGNGSISFLGETIGGDNAFHKKKNSVYLEGADFQMQPSFTRVAPAGGGGGRRDNLPVLRGFGSDCAVFDTLKPMILLLKIMGVFPIANVTAGKYQVTPALAAYSVTLYLFFVAYVAYIKWDRVEILGSIFRLFGSNCITSHYVVSIFNLNANLHCDAVGKVATVIADDFEAALKNIGPAVKVAEYRSLWMLMGKISREVGLSNCYVMIFLNLYLFLIITLTIYGLLSQIQAGLGMKDIGLAINAGCAIVLLYLICDEAHFASRCVKVHFQKKLLLVELSWMNDDAQQEINMFLKATEMNMTDMSLGGFFDMNRNLFKSLLATMVTYLVVLLQFQISIPEDIPEELTALVATVAPKK